MTVAVLPRVLGRPIMTDERDAEQRVLMEITEALERTKYQPLRRVDASYDAGTVTLLGIVPTYFLKQVAQVAAMSVSGVRRIDDQLRVADEQRHRSEPVSEQFQCSVFHDPPPRDAVLAYA